MIARLWSTVARNRAIAEAEAFDLPPVKVLIFGAGLKGPPALKSPVCPELNQYSPRLTQKRKRGKEKIDKGRKIEE